jgi:hypothetical protein
MGDPIRREGIKIVHSFEPGENPVAMVVFKGQVLVATSRAIYRMEKRGAEDVMVPMQFVTLPGAA